MTDIQPDITQLSNREADRMLAQARRGRLAEIDRYWALCHADPARAQAAAAGAPAIVGEIFQLACNTDNPPAPAAVSALSVATARLLGVPAIRDALVDEVPVDGIWENGQVVALKTVDGERVLVLRYDGPLFNPGTVPQDSLSAGANCHVVCLEASDGQGGDYEFLRAYVIGRINANGEWETLTLDLASRSDLMRDLEVMEALVDRGQLDEEFRERSPLPTFPTPSDGLIAELKAHQACLRRQGAMTDKQQAVVDGNTAHLYRRAERLRRHMQRVEDALHRIRRQITDIEARALEAETGFERGDQVRHRSTGDLGQLEIVHVGDVAQFRLCGTTIYVTEDIRRGEWSRLVRAGDTAGTLADD